MDGKKNVNKIDTGVAYGWRFGEIDVTVDGMLERLTSQAGRLKSLLHVKYNRVKASKSAQLVRVRTDLFGYLATRQKAHLQIK